MNQLRLQLRGKPCHNGCIASQLGQCEGCDNGKCVCCQNICTCNQCHVLCWNNPDKQKILKDLGTFEFENNGHQKSMELPRFVPLIYKDRIDLSKYASGFQVVAITLKDIFSRGNVRDIIKKGIHAYYNLPQQVRIVLILTAKEDVLEDLWSNHYVNNLFEQVSKLDIYAVVGTNFTVAENHPRLLHIVNMRKNNIMFNGLQKVGMRVVPDISWFNQRDIDKWMHWIDVNKIQTIGITTQCMRSGGSHLFEDVISKLQYIESRIGTQMHYVFNGPGTVYKMNRITSSFKNVTIVSSQPYKKAMAGRRAYISDNIIRYVKDLSGTKEELFINNAVLYDDIVATR